MKKILLTFLFLSIIFTQTPKTFAGVWCDLCFNPIIIDPPAELKTTVMSVLDIAGAISESSFTASWIAQLGLDTMANAAKRVAIKNITSSITTWANGGFQGDPTFVFNPDTYFKNIETSGIRIGLNEINKAGGDLLSDNITNSIAKNFRQEKATIDQKTEFTLGSTIQNKICNDSNLSAMAKNAADDVLSGTAYNAKKTELANSLCSGDASKDKNTQQAMVNIYKEDFSAGGGWDSWLDLTSNPKNTEYGNVSSAKVALSKKVESKKEIAKDEVEQGGGYIGIKTCIKEVYLETEGITSCEEYETKTPGKLAADQISEAVSGSPDTLKKAQGFTDMAAEILGGVIDGMVGNFIGKGLSGMIGSGGGGGETGSLNSNVSFTLTTGNNKTTTPNTYQQNAVLTKEEKATAIDQMIKQLEDDTETINSLKTIDRKPYLDYLITYETRLLSLESKYETLVKEFPLYNNYAMVTYGKLYVKNQKEKISEFRTRIITDESNLSEAEKIISLTKASLAKATTITEVQSTYQSYIDRVPGHLIPAKNSNNLIETEYKSIKDDLERDITDNMTRNTSSCEAAIQLERSKKECSERGAFWSWNGSSCYYRHRDACVAKGSQFVWVNPNCVDTTPSQQFNW